jgi:hypothetical protein
MEANADLDTFVGIESIDTYVGIESIDEAVGIGIAAGGGGAGQVGETGTCTNLGTSGSTTFTYVSHVGATCTGDITEIQVYRGFGTNFTVAVFSQATTTITPVASSDRAVTVAEPDDCKTLTGGGVDFANIPIESGQFFGWYGDNNFYTENAWSGHDGVSLKSGDCTTSECTSCTSNAAAATGLIGVITCD